MARIALPLLGCVLLVGCAKPSVTTQAPKPDPFDEVSASHDRVANALREVKGEADIKKAIEAIDKETEVMKQRPVLPNEIASDVKPDQRAGAMLLLERKFEQVARDSQSVAHATIHLPTKGLDFKGNPADAPGPWGDLFRSIERYGAEVGRVLNGGPKHKQQQPAMLK